MLARTPIAPELVSRVSDEAHRYLDAVRGRGWLDTIRAAFDRADQLKIAFVGETIIDEYRYVSPLAKPSKEFILATVEAREPEQFLGGTEAASLHGGWRDATLVTNSGEPLRKTRYVDADFGRKLFEVYSHPRLVREAWDIEPFRRNLSEAVEDSDVVIVFDFGHGLMDALERECVGAAKFLAVNAQTNAGNYGYNTVSKYLRANLVCVDMPEARLNAGLQHEDDPAILASRIAANAVIITHGRHGSYCPQHVPAFGSRALDTMGAGDAFLAVAAPLVAAGLELECAAFVGNVAGAIKTDIVGHRRHVGRDELLQAVEGLLS
jgi:bifunctional ADP-heptose synthase (sugar kinase/adenylyltransferase)